MGARGVWRGGLVVRGLEGEEFLSGRAARRMVEGLRR